jgi:GT2 family glycosyltransferase
VSVIVVCWNSEDVLGRCLDRLLDENYENYEIVVVDDGSQDDTVEVAKRALGSGRVTIVSSPLNRGCPHARNLGLRHAKGEIIAFIDADGFAAPDWLREIVAAFAADETVGGVASTVFFASNPLILNGAGGIVNRQGWAGDASWKEHYERAEILCEAIYPMGCGMALRRSAVERVGLFDDRMLNYYDDVDYGLRLWRAGYRVVVAPDAWIDHAFGHSGGDSLHKQLLCFQHQMLCMLKHASLGTLARWVVSEALATTRAWSPQRELKLQAMRWNVRHLPRTLLSRWRLRRSPRPPDRLIAPWGDRVTDWKPSVGNPQPESASNSIDMSDPDVDGQLPYGWFDVEHDGQRSYRWAGARASVLFRLDAPAARLRFSYCVVSPDVGTIELNIRQVDSPDPVNPVWTIPLPWRGYDWWVERHPISLAPGVYEVVFSAENTWSNPPLEPRPIALALANMSFDDSWEMVAAGVDFSNGPADEQLLSGWFRPELIDRRAARWATGRAAAIVRVPDSTTSLSLSYRLPPGPIGGLKISVRRPVSWRVVWSMRLANQATKWRDESFPVRLQPGDYAVSFDAERTWTNPGGQDPAFVADDRCLGFALSSLRFHSAKVTQAS